MTGLEALVDESDTGTVGTSSPRTIRAPLSTRSRSFGNAVLTALRRSALREPNLNPSLAVFLRKRYSAERDSCRSLFSGKLTASYVQHTRRARPEASLKARRVLPDRRASL
jgi:hypothetical protein